MRINLRKTKPMKRDLAYTTDDWRLRPFDPTRVFAPSPHQNRQFAPPVEQVGLMQLAGLPIEPFRDVVFDCSGELINRGTTLALVQSVDQNIGKHMAQCPDDDAVTVSVADR